MKLDRHIKYRRSKKGIIQRRYNDILRRIKGKRPNWNSYIGLEVLLMEDFISWSTNNKKLDKIYNEWIERNYDYKYSPSIDRLNPTLGYTLDNLDWCTVSENTKRMHMCNKTR